MNQRTQRAVGEGTCTACRVTESLVRPLCVPDLNHAAAAPSRGDVHGEPRVINDRDLRAMERPRCSNQVKQVPDLGGDSIAVWRKGNALCTFRRGLTDRR